MFSSEFTDQRAQLIPHDHAPHLECIVIVSTKHLLHVYHCQQSILVFIESSIQTPDIFKFKQFKWPLKICWSWGGAKGHIGGPGADPKDILEAPKGTVPFGKMTRVDND